MHHCLQIAEIQYEIASFLPKSAGAVLARTCRPFYEAAMDAVWADVDCINHLIRCMPPDLWVERDVVHRSGRYINREISFTRDPTDDEWQLFTKHAWRVRRFTLCGGNVGEAVPGIIAEASLITVAQYMCDVAPTQSELSFFPNLITLRMPWCAKNEVIPRFIASLCGRSLHNIQLMTTGHELSHTYWESDAGMKISKLGDILARKCPNVHNVVVIGIWGCQPIRLDSVKKIPKLRRFSTQLIPTIDVRQGLSGSRRDGQYPRGRRNVF